MKDPAILAIVGYILTFALVIVMYRVSYAVLRFVVRGESL